MRPTSQRPRLLQSYDPFADRVGTSSPEAATLQTKEQREKKIFDDRLRDVQEVINDLVEENIGLRVKLTSSGSELAQSEREVRRLERIIDNIIRLIDGHPIEEDDHVE